MVVQVHPRSPPNQEENCHNNEEASKEEEEEVPKEEVEAEENRVLLSVDTTTLDKESITKRDINEDWPLKFALPSTIDREESTFDQNKRKCIDLLKTDQRRLSDRTVNKLTSTFGNMIDRHNIHRVLGHKIWFVTDVCGIICASFTYWLLLFAQYVVLTCILLPEESVFYKCVNLLIFELLTFLAIASHMKTMCTDPGAVPRGTATREAIESLGLSEGQVLYKCQKCCSIKPERAHHCSVCQRCIRKMDHHCPWVNNCVGENNQKFFVLFTLYIALISCHTLLMAVLHFIKCIDSDWKQQLCLFNPVLAAGFNITDCPSVWTSSSSSNTLNGSLGLNNGHTTTHHGRDNSVPWTIILLVCLVFEALLFSIFTLIMFGVQIQAIWNDETGIEHLKKENINKGSRRSWSSFRSVFGKGTFSITWLSPFTRPLFSGEVLENTKFGSYAV